MALAASGRPSATGSPSVVIESMSMLFGRRVRRLDRETAPLRSQLSCEGAASESEVLARMIVLR